MQISRKSRADLPLCQKLLQNEGALSPRVGMPAIANRHDAFAIHPRDYC